ncbi:VaFE repeat-containing surface-anchored protein [Listeria monocytogenes]|nr:VaFE repeat-containing surface-anchored protein [Listeria monocytogenes]
MIDTVTLEGLTKGTVYTLKGWQMIKEEKAELIINGEVIVNDYTFTADKENMEVQISFTFDASELEGKQIVTFEELYDMSNPDKLIKVAEHKGIEDEGQIITITEAPKPD